MRLRSLALATLTAYLASGGVARADNISPKDAFDLQLFRPAIDTKGYITVNASQVLGLWDFSIGLLGTLAASPLVLENPTNHTKWHADFVLTPSLQAAIGFKYLELAVSVPVQIVIGGADPAYHSTADANFSNAFSFSGQGLGDLGVHLKARFLNTSKYPVGLALLVSAYIPSTLFAGDAARQFLSDGAFGIAPSVIVDREFGRKKLFRMSLNVGARIRTGGTHTFTDMGQTFDDPGNANTMVPPKKGLCGPMGSDASGNIDGTCGTGAAFARSLGTQLTYGLGASYAVIKEKFDLLAELYGAAGVDGSGHTFPLEAVVGGKVYLAKNSFFTFGGGGSAIPDQTQGALWRIFLGFVFEPAIGDRDGDGIKDDVDKCPDDPEDFDDFEDSDGCPDPDNDRDGIPDEKDKCPNEPETKNGFEDEDGCPDTVELDRDGDGIPDSKDQCPDDPEDKDGFEDEDGCPDPDNDKDGILDIDDQCPNDPEDKDGFEDTDGCPDPDNDKDRILDVNDKCPNDPETYNGYQDEDGCPDKGKVIVRHGQIEILEVIHFQLDKAIILPDSFPLLDAIVATLKGNPQITLIEIQGHADERGDAAHNATLTEDRAQSVKQYLIDHGVDKERLQSHGYGKTRPKCSEHTEDCWSKNRRVEFVILKRSDT